MSPSGFGLEAFVNFTVKTAGSPKNQTGESIPGELPGMPQFVKSLPSGFVDGTDYAGEGEWNYRIVFPDVVSANRCSPRVVSSGILADLQGSPRLLK